MPRNYAYYEALFGSETRENIKVPRCNRRHSGTKAGSRWPGRAVPGLQLGNMKLAPREPKGS
jgi:hypothetical protein